MRMTAESPTDRSRTDQLQNDRQKAEAALARRRQAYGLLLLAGLILLAMLLRAPAHVLFPTGWWRF